MIFNGKKSRLETMKVGSECRGRDDSGVRGLPLNPIMSSAAGEQRTFLESLHKPPNKMAVSLFSVSGCLQLSNSASVVRLSRSSSLTDVSCQRCRVKQSTSRQDLFAIDRSTGIAPEFTQSGNFSAMAMTPSGYSPPPFASMLTS